MHLREILSIEELTPARLWPELSAETRRIAAESLYKGRRDEGSGRHEADGAIASALHFREVTVRKLPLERRMDYLLRSVHPDDSLASTLLLSLHLERRTPLLEAFLDRLGIPQQGGMIDESHELETIETTRLSQAASHLYESFPEDETDVYLASLLAMDPETWGGLREVLRQRADR